MHELPEVGQSLAWTHALRHLPNAQTRPVKQSLLREQPPVTVADTELEQAGMTAPRASETPISHAADLRPVFAFCRLCVTRFIASSRDRRTPIARHAHDRRHSQIPQEMA